MYVALEIVIIDTLILDLLFETCITASFMLFMFIVIKDINYNRVVLNTFKFILARKQLMYPLCNILY